MHAIWPLHWFHQQLHLHRLFYEVSLKDRSLETHWYKTGKRLPFAVVQNVKQRRTANHKPLLKQHYRYWILIYKWALEYPLLHSHALLLVHFRLKKTAESTRHFEETLVRFSRSEERRVGKGAKD